MTESNEIVGQKWVVRRKEKDGKFKHIVTFEQEPFQNDLQKFGNGEYSIMTTKPSFKFCKKVLIGETTKEDNLPKIQKAPQNIEPKNESTPQLQQKQQINTNPIIEHKTTQNSQSNINQLTNSNINQNLQPKIKTTSQPNANPIIKNEIKQNSQPETNPQQHQPIQKSQIKHSPTSFRKFTQNIPQKTKSIIPSNKPILQRKSISSESHSNIIKRETNNFQKNIREKHFVIKKVIPNEDGKKVLADISDIYRKKPTKDDIEQYKEVYGGGKYFIVNKGTNKTEEIVKIKEETNPKNLIEEYDICSECEKRLKISNSRTCKFCENKYCKNCIDEHECECSFVCYYCNNRKEYNDLEVVSDYCRNIFCSPKCLEKCFNRNGYKKDCENCDAKEIYEDEDIPITCGECGCEFTISEDEVDDIICPKCETELKIEE